MSRFGRLPVEDPRDRAFGFAAVLPPAPIRRYRYYWSSWFGDQGDEPACVGFALTHWLHSGPVTQSGDWEVYAPYVYRQAQFRDEWPGEGYDGTSIRAGAKFLVEEGYISEYRWAWSAGEIVRAVLDVGPVVLGIDWYESMEEPYLEAGRVQEVSGQVLGGHAVMIDGANLDEQMVRVKNSWGRGWGDRGRFWLTISQLEFLLQDEGEACLAIEVPKP